MHRLDRLSALLGAGIADSFGMSVGWTAVVLTATARGGLSQAALLNAAMLAGVVASAPVAGWCARRLAGGRLLRLAALAEMLLRGLVLAGVQGGASPALVAAAVLLMNVAGWVLFAGMRAEVTAVDATPRSITRYAVCIAGVEAVGAAVAALLPSGITMDPAGLVGALVWIAYPVSLLPTLLVASRSRVGVTQPRMAQGPPAWRRPRSTRASWPSIRLLAVGGAVMLLAAGPTLLAVPLVEELYGGVWVAGAAFAFCAGTLLAAPAVTAAIRVGVPVVLRWPLWGLGMLAGWSLAPLWAPMVLVAQLGAGLSQAALEGDMDARIAAGAGRGEATRSLAYSAAVRALGGAAGVRILPALVSASAVGMAAGVAMIVVLFGALLMWCIASVTAHRSWRTA